MPEQISRRETLRGLAATSFQRIQNGILQVQAPHYPTLQNPLRADDMGHGFGDGSSCGDF